MKKTLMTGLLIVALLLALAHPVAAQEAESASLREGRIGAGAYFSLGRLLDDPVAIAGAAFEYGVVDRSTLGIGYAYLDGYLMQADCLEAYARVYVLNGALGLYLRPSILIIGWGTETMDAVFDLGAGIEWQSPWLVYAAVQATVLFQNDERGYMVGACLGLRL
ncbi:MAG TPA: hypothetical protein PK625_02070 [Spirochaetales bacterium]|nr:hypothetical protein [Spirochaetia bacterium]HPE35907.1 hypothetical protein [Spirochaetales bacterium]